MLDNKCQVLAVLEELKMVHEKPSNKAKSANPEGACRIDSTMGRAFDKLVQLFNINGIIYGSSVCRPSISNSSGTKKGQEGQK